MARWGELTTAREPAQSRPTPARRYGFFGRRQVHQLRPKNAELLRRLLPELAIDLSAPPPEPITALFSVAVEEVVLEIGFGGGEHLLAQALAHRRAGFIGCDPFVNGMAKILAGIAAHGCGNIRLHLGDALAVLDWLPEACLGGIYILYPDPWPKRRHAKRRLVQDATLPGLARALRPGGFIRLATDSSDYAAAISACFARAAAFAPRPEPNPGAPPWPGFVGTKYAAKAAREGRASCYFEFRRR